jgi:hypothetical protein
MLIIFQIKIPKFIDTLLNRCDDFVIFWSYQFFNDILLVPWFVDICPIFHGDMQKWIKKRKMRYLGSVANSINKRKLNYNAHFLYRHTRVTWRSIYTLSTTKHTRY